MFKTVLALLDLVLITTCDGEHFTSVTSPKNITCDTAFAGDWHWILQTCGGFSDDVSHGQLSTTNGCRLTLDTTPAALKEKGQTFTMVVAFDTKKVTLERKGTVCDAIDQGTIESQLGRTFSIHFVATPVEKCCTNDYFATIAY